MEVGDFLSRLQGVRKTGHDKWAAKCPAHEDRSPSLSVRVLADGRILLHDFAGCSPVDVVGSMGLELGDLFAEPLYHRARPVANGLTAMDALRSLRREGGIVALVASDIAEGKALTPADADRVAQAVGRIAGALETVHGT